MPAAINALKSRSGLFILALFPIYVNGAEPASQSTTDKLQVFEEIEASIYAGWESHYFSEGRDVLDGDSLIVSSVQLGWEFFSSEIWYGTSPDQSYDELQLTVEAAQTIGKFEFYLWYTHYQFPSDNLNDNEIGGGLTIAQLPAEFEVAAEAYYSFDADGFFALFTERLARLPLG